MEKLNDADMLSHLIDARGVTQATVARETRISESTISHILSGSRKLNRRHIEVFSKYFSVSPAVFFTQGQMR